MKNQHLSQREEKRKQIYAEILKMKPTNNDMTHSKQEIGIYQNNVAGKLDSQPKINPK